MHAMHDSVDIRRMGGLMRKMPFTFWTFLIATLSIAGIPGFAGFFSKDDIVGAVYSQAQHTAWMWIIWIMLVLTAGLTALYMFRLLFLVFLGESRDPQLADHAHDPGLVWKIPMSLLTILSIIGGYLAIPDAKDEIGDWLGHSFTRYAPAAPVLPAAQWVSLIVTTVVVLMGVFMAYLVYVRKSPAPESIANSAAPLYQLFANRWYIDQLYDVAIVRPFLLLGLFLNTIVEKLLVNGIVDGSALAVRGSASDLRRVQTGYVRNYALSILFGAALVVFYYVIHK